MSETAEEYASRMLARFGAGWKSNIHFKRHYEALLEFERTAPQREARRKRIIEESRSLSREELEERLQNLLAEAEEESQFRHEILKAQQYIINKQASMLESVEKDSIGIKEAIEAFEKVTSEFIELINDTRKDKKLYLKEIEETKKVRKKMIAEIEAYNKRVLGLNQKYLEFEKRVKRFNKRAREVAHRMGFEVV